MDKETEQIFSEGEALSDYVKTRAWKIIKEIISNHILDLQSVMNIKSNGPTDMAREVFARQLAIDYLLVIVKEIEGKAQQHDSNKALTEDRLQII